MDVNSVFTFSDEWNLHKEDLKEKKYYLFNVKKGDIIQLNEVSFEIFRNIDGNNSVEMILKKIHEMYYVEKELLLEDLVSVLNKGIKEKILKKNN